MGHIGLATRLSRFAASATVVVECHVVELYHDSLVLKYINPAASREGRQGRQSLGAAE